MLIVSREKDESLFIFVPGREAPIRILIVDLKGDQIKLGIDADQDIPVLRSELLTEEGKRGL